MIRFWILEILVLFVELSSCIHVNEYTYGFVGHGVHDSWVLEMTPDARLTWCLRRCRLNVKCVSIGLGPLDELDEEKSKTKIRDCYIMTEVDYKDCEDKSCKSPLVEVYMASHLRPTSSQAETSTIIATKVPTTTAPTKETTTAPITMTVTPTTTTALRPTTSIPEKPTTVASTTTTLEPTTTTTEKVTTTTTTTTKIPTTTTTEQPTTTTITEKPTTTTTTEKPTTTTTTTEKSTTTTTTGKPTTTTTEKPMTTTTEKPMTTITEKPTTTTTTEKPMTTTTTEKPMKTTTTEKPMKTTTTEKPMKTTTTEKPETTTTTEKPATTTTTEKPTTTTTTEKPTTTTTTEKPTTTTTIEKPATTTTTEQPTTTTTTEKPTTTITTEKPTTTTTTTEKPTTTTTTEKPTTTTTTEKPTTTTTAQTTTTTRGPATGDCVGEKKILEWVGSSGKGILYKLSSTSPLFTNIDLTAEKNDFKEGQLYDEPPVEQTYFYPDEKMACSEDSVITGLEICIKGILQYIGITCSKLNSDKGTLQPGKRVTSNPPHTSVECADDVQYHPIITGIALEQADMSFIVSLDCQFVKASKAK